MLEETEFGCLKSCVRQRKGTKKQQQEQKKRPPVLIFLALSLLTRAVWFLLFDYWTELKQFDCEKRRDRDSISHIDWTQHFRVLVSIHNIITHCNVSCSSDL